MKKDPQRNSTSTFQATLVPGNPRLGWVIAHLPASFNKTTIPTPRLRISGKINGFPFQTTLFPNGHGGFFLLVNKDMQRGADVKAGEKATISFSAAPCLTKEEIAIPSEFKRILMKEKDLQHWYQTLNPSTRRDLSRWLLEATSKTTREKRAIQLAERLASTMEAELELPPILKLAFFQNPQARIGWDSMTKRQQRQQLMAIFSYQSPEARQKRVSKLVEHTTLRRSKTNSQSRSSSKFPPQT